MMTTQTQFPALVGSPKQIAWADEIRMTADALLTDTLTRARAEGYPTLAMLEVMAARWAQLVAETPDAAWWINHRGYTAQVMGVGLYMLTSTRTERRAGVAFGTAPWTPADAYRTLPLGR